MNPSPIIGKRIKMLRMELGYNQQQFAEKLSEFMGRPSTLSTMTVSNWESGRKLPPFDTMLWMQRFLGVSIDYLAGLTDNKTIGGSPKSQKLSPADSLKKGIEIPLRDLSRHDGDPVFVVFPSTYQNQWGIIDYPRRIIVFKDFNLTINEHCQYYSYLVPEEVTIRSLANHLLGMEGIMKKKRVWIESLSPDPYMRGKINGWYHHSPDKSFLINDIGYALSYDGLGITYNALDYKYTPIHKGYEQE